MTNNVANKFFLESTKLIQYHFRKEVYFMRYFAAEFSETLKFNEVHFHLDHLFEEQDLTLFRKK